MKVKLVCMGKTDKEYIIEGVKEYEKRLKHYISFESVLLPELEKQIRIEGRIEKTSDEVSDEYYLSRPAKSRIGSWASPQSREIPDRKFLEEKQAEYEHKFEGHLPPRPKNWGGYILIPYTFEFWQGRPSRLHDRIEYYYDDNNWKIRRLAP